jgi:hypothetical protein
LGDQAAISESALFDQLSSTFGCDPGGPTISSVSAPFWQQDSTAVSLLAAENDKLVGHGVDTLALSFW